MNNKDGELTEEEYREVIKYGRGILINIIIGVVAAVVIAIKTILWRISYEKS